MTVEERVRIGEDLLGADTEEVLGAFADVGVANVAPRRNHALVDHPGNAVGQRREPLIGPPKAARASFLLDCEAGQRAQCQQNLMIEIGRRSRHAEMKGQRADGPAGRPLKELDPACLNIVGESQASKRGVRRTVGHVRND